MQRAMSFRAGDKVALAPCPPTCEAAWVLNASAESVFVTFEPGSTDDPEEVPRRSVVAWGGRFPMTEPELPAAFLFLHLEKTGGTSVRTWLALNQDTSRFQEPARLQLVSPDCFEALTLDTGRVRDACPGPVQPVAWDRSITAVEYHSGGAKAQFWRHVDHARSLYAKAGGRFLTAVLLQEPVAQAVSFYRYWPPTEQGPDGPNSLIPLERWVRSGTANSFLQSRGIATTRGGDCNQSARMAMRRLGEIGLGECSGI